MKMTILSEEQLFNNELFDKYKYGRFAKVTDFATLLGASPFYADFGDTTFSKYMTSTIEGTKRVDCYYGEPAHRDYNDRNIAVRPVIDDYSLVEKNKDKIITKDGVEMLPIGRFPQSFVDKDTLHSIYKDCNYSNRTKNVYTINNQRLYLDSSDEYPFMKEVYEFNFNGKNYTYYDLDNTNENAATYNLKYDYCTYWINIEPIYWIIDHKNKLLISENCLLGGLHTDVSYRSKNINNDFENTQINYYLNNIFGKEIIQEKKLIK